MTKARAKKLSRREPPRFDAVVVGSSPLMMLQAKRLAEEGQRVCIVERSSSLGGAWQIRTLKNGIRAEIGCHLIEYFPSVYEILERETGIKFTPAEHKPIRIHPSGVVVPYHSRFILLASGVRMALGLASTGFQSAFLGRQQNEFLNYRSKLASMVNHQAGVFFGRNNVLFPSSGFAEFNDALVRKAKTAGARFETDEITSVAREGGVWTVFNQSGAMLTASSVYCTSTASLKHVAAYLFEAIGISTRLRWSAVISIPESDVRQEQLYAAFWKDPFTTRISLIKGAGQPAAERLFLMELRQAPPENGSAMFQDTMRKKLQTARVLKPGGSFAVAAFVNCELVDNLNHLPDGEIDENFFVLSSHGNLAAGIAKWLRRVSRPPEAGRGKLAVDSQ